MQVTTRYRTPMCVPHYSEYQGHRCTRWRRFLLSGSTRAVNSRNVHRREVVDGLSDNVTQVVKEDLSEEVMFER